MVIIISGASHTGKTNLAQKLLEKYKYPYLSIDHLKMGLYRANQNCGFTPLDRTEVIGDKLWPIVKGMIMTNIENEQHLIIEGSYLLPHHLNDLDKRHLEKIISVFFGFSTNYILENFANKIVKHRNVIERRNWPEERTIQELIQEHEDFKMQCLQAGVTYFEIANNYDKEIGKVYDYIEQRFMNLPPRL